jgi:hypothetical protein
MPTDQYQTFYVGGLPILYSQIENWYNSYCSKTPKHLRTIPDPYYSEKSAWFIAQSIVNDINKKANTNFFDVDDIEKEDKPKSSIIKTENSVDDFIYHDTNKVIEEAFKEKERIFREQQEEIIRQRKLQEELKKQYQNSYIPPPPPKPKVERSFREVLQIPSSIILTKEIIKKAYFKQAQKCHPDHGGSVEKFQELLDARDKAELLIDI